MTVFAHINSWDDIPHAVSKMQMAGAGHRVPLLQALYHGEIAHVEMQRSGSAKNFKMWAAAIRLPGLMLIGDDDHAAEDGPETWPIAPRALRWARFVLIHGGAGDPEHYEYTVVLAQEHKRLLMIECSSAAIPAWAAAADRWGRGVIGQIMMPPPGCPHPSLTPGKVQ